jgi:tyrosine-protein phosphatase SIW14
MRSFTRIIGTAGVTNFGFLTSSIFRSAQPDTYGWQVLKALGITRVLNLRTEHPDPADVLGQLGMEEVAYPMNVLDPPPIASLKTIVDLLAVPGPVWHIHCAQGQDRTGLVCAAYRILKQGWSHDEAEEEMQVYIPCPWGETWLPIRQRLEELSKEVIAWTEKLTR